MTITDQRDALAEQTATTQRLLDALLIEQREAPDEVTRVRRSGDASAYSLALLRRDNLPHEIHDAQVLLARAQLAEAWAQVGPAIAAADEARAEFTVASAERAAFEQRPRRQIDNATRYVAEQAELAVLVDAVDAARAAHDNAEHAAAAALYEIDQLEDTVELLTGDRPDDGSASRPLGQTVVLTAPTGYGVDVRVFEAGTVPPRWAGFLLRHSETAWSTSSRPTAPAGPSMLALDDGVTFRTGVRPDDAA